MQMFTSTSKPPPPHPWIALAAISMAALTLTADSSEPTKKTRLAMSSMGLRPKMSDTLPQIGVDAAAPSKYAEPIQV